jgi:hypothetical protein
MQSKGIEADKVQLVIAAAPGRKNKSLRVPPLSF